VLESSFHSKVATSGLLMAVADCGASAETRPL